ncbi:MAG: hypothetical protein QQN55_01205 [Nitrosopumilus sp.]
MTISKRKIKSIKEALKDDSLSYEIISRRHHVEESQVEAIDNGDDPNEIEDPENTCSFCGVECEDFFCSRECRIAESND